MAFLRLQAQLLLGLVDRVGAAGVVGEHAHRVRRQAGRGREHGRGLPQLRLVGFERVLGELADLRDGETFGPLRPESQRYIFTAVKQYTQLEKTDNG